MCVSASFYMNSVNSVIHTTTADGHVEEANYSSAAFPCFKVDTELTRCERDFHVASVKRVILVSS